MSSADGSEQTSSTIEGQEGQVGQIQQGDSGASGGVDDIRAEIERLKAENERLRTAKAARAKKGVTSKAGAKKKTPAKKTAAKKVTRDADGKATPAKKKAPAKKAKKSKDEGPVEIPVLPPRKKVPGKPHYLVIVESPAKAKTIKKYLGSAYTVKASVGHVKDLPKSKIGVDVESGFEPEYQVIKTKAKVVAELRREAAGSDIIYLATDPDREGEAIAWHIAEELDHPDTKRVLFNEVTKRAILQALQEPQGLNRPQYDSQQARRILDRLVGYQISPLLWKKIQRGLSAGRVQSVAVRLVVDREAEIKAFVPVEYWTLDADLQGKLPPAFRAHLAKVDGKKAALTTGEQTKALVDAIKAEPFRVTKVEKKERKRHPPPPFITSKLQQEAANRLHFSAKKTMTLAQKLYEGISLGKEEGQTALITYMRTDSTRIGGEALESVRGFIDDKYGKTHLPEKPNFYRSKKGAQDAHEAIRPVSIEWPPERLAKYLKDDDRDFLRLYELIWNRFVASQMTSAIYDQTAADIEAGRALFRATGSTLKFAGYLAVYGAVPTTDEESEREKAEKAGEDVVDDSRGELPPIEEGQVLELLKLIDEQHFTQPPPRFSEATLVKTLEEQGIGRPSTYAAILSTIQDKKYVEKVENRFRPTILGGMITEMLVQHFPNEMDVTFTAGLEEKLDSISEGESDWRKVLSDFYGPFRETLTRAETEMRDVKREEIETDVKCEKCGSPMVIKWGKMGHFLACSAYPDCKSTAEFKEVDGKIVVLEEETTDEVCDKCGKPMIVKRGRFGRFLACSGYPDCKSSKPMSIGVSCPKCEKGYISERRSKRGKVFFGCSQYPECDFVAWDRPMNEPCPDCDAKYLLQKYSKREGPYKACADKECGFKAPLETPATAAAS